MLAIVKITDGKPTGWILATDLGDATRKAFASGNQELADRLYQMPPESVVPLPSQQELMPGTWLLSYQWT